MKCCWYVDESMYVKGRGYRPAVAIEGQPGFKPNRGVAGPVMYWGDTLDEARKIAARRNAAVGLTPEDTERIVASAKAAKKEQESA